MADKYKAIINGVDTEVEFLTTSSGSADAGKAFALGASGTIPLSMMPSGIGAETTSLVASEALSAGELVNIWDDVGTPKVRLADASNGRQADGFVLATAAIGASIDVYTDGALTGIVVVAGTNYWLSDTPGQFTTVVPINPPSTINQLVGRASNNSQIIFSMAAPTLLA